MRDTALFYGQRNRRFRCGGRELDRLLPAVVQAIETGYATAVIDRVRLAVDARRFAFRSAYAATVAVVLVDPDFEQRVFAQETQQRADRTDRIAVRATVFPCQKTDDSERGQCDDKSQRADDGDFRAVESIVVEFRENRFQQVVAGHVDRAEDIRYQPPVSPVRIEQAQHDGQAEQVRDYDDSEHRPP